MPVDLKRRPGLQMPPDTNDPSRTSPRVPAGVVRHNFLIPLAEKEKKEKGDGGRPTGCMIILFIMIQCTIIQCTNIQCTMIQCTMIQCTMIQFTIIQCTMI